MAKVSACADGLAPFAGSCPSRSPDHRSDARAVAMPTGTPNSSCLRYQYISSAPTHPTATELENSVRCHGGRILAAQRPHEFGGTSPSSDTDHADRGQGRRGGREDEFTRFPPSEPSPLPGRRISLGNPPHPPCTAIRAADWAIKASPAPPLDCPLNGVKSISRTRSRAQPPKVSPSAPRAATGDPRFLSPGLAGKFFFSIILFRALWGY